MPQHDAKTKRKVLSLLAAGKSQGEVSRLLKIPQPTISRWVHNAAPAPVAVPPSALSWSTPPIITQKIALASLCLDAGTQMRESLNLATIAEYAEAMSDGSKFPPIIVFSDGATHWLGDGFQRVKAAEQVGYIEMDAEVRPGTLRDAVLFACGCNATHGERRTNRDKRKAVLTLLGDPEWVQWSDNRIANMCRVSQPFVSEVRQSFIVTSNVISDDSNTRQYTDKHGNIATMDTGNIGKRATREPTSVETPLSDNGVAPVPDAPVDDPPSLEMFPATPPLPPNPTTHPPTVPHCPTCAQVRPLVDHALSALRRLTLEQRECDGVRDYQAALEAIRALIPIPTGPEGYADA